MMINKNEIRGTVVNMWLNKNKQNEAVLDIIWKHHSSSSSVSPAVLSAPSPGWVCVPSFPGTLLTKGSSLRGGGAADSLVKG